MEFLLHVCDFSKRQIWETRSAVWRHLLIQQIFLRSAQCRAVCVHLWALDRVLCPERSKLTLAESSSFSLSSQLHILCTMVTFPHWFYQPLRSCQASSPGQVGPAGVKTQQPAVETEWNECGFQLLNETDCMHTFLIWKHDLFHHIKNLHHTHACRKLKHLEIDLKKQ